MNLGGIPTYSNHPIILKIIFKILDMRVRTVLIETRWDYVKNFTIQVEI